MLLALFACAPPPPPPNPGGDVALAVRWQDGPAPRGAARFHLDAAAPAGTTLGVDGAWWRVDLTLDGAPLAPVYPGYAPLDVPLPALAAGDHVLTVSISLPTTEAPVLTLPNKNRRPRFGALTLRLDGEARVGALTAPLVDGALAPTVTVVGAPPGATLELAVGRDGDVVVGWEPVAAGAALPPKPWRGERWAIGAPELYVATAVLRDAGGAVLDTRSERIGVRDATLVDGRLALDGTARPLLALRDDPDRDPAEAAAHIAAAGGNAIELHGAIVGADWYAKMDEWGLPVLQVARCDGRLWEGGRDMSSTLRALAPALAEQERRLLDAAAARPAVLAWICEGTGHFRDALCGGLRADPLHRPVLGLDVPSIVIDGRHPHVSTVPTWVTEIGASAQQVPPPADLAGAALLRATGPAGPGGVAQPVPRTTAELAAWSAGWSATARTLGVTAWAPRTRRASSTLTVRGLAPGALVTLDAPWMARLGATADDTGAARFSVWYEGAATLTSAGGTQAVTLRADVWEGTTRVDRGVTVDVP